MEHCPQSWKLGQTFLDKTASHQASFTEMLSIGGEKLRDLSSSHHAPIRFSCCRPTLATQFGLDFPWLMRWEPEGALDWSERTCSSATRTFHHADGTGRKSFEINGNHRSRKRAFGCGA